MKICKYQLVDAFGKEQDEVYETYIEATDAADVGGFAIIELQFEFIGTELVYTPDGSGTWPPPF